MKFNLNRAKKVLSKWHNKYEGKRGFIIGNGPSLRPEDLDKVKDEISIACNRVYIIFDKTEWRPTVYHTHDRGFIESAAKEISDLKVPIKCVDICDQYELPEIKGALYTNFITNYNGWISKGELPPFSEDIVTGTHYATNATYTNLQIAVYLGLKEIILLGVDHRYPKHWHIDEENPIITENEF